jgi:CTP synthase
LEESLAHRIYKATEITERHRHRYEVSLSTFMGIFEKAGLVFSGMSLDGNLPEIVEIKGHPFFIATQAHPEFKSYPFSPHPCFHLSSRRLLRQRIRARLPEKQKRYQKFFE